MLFSLMSMDNLTPMEAVMLFVITTIVFVLSLVIHELAHGFVAYKCGDDTPKLAGRLTLNPVKHLSLMGVLMFLFIGVGWANPMPVNPLKYKKFKKGQRLVAIAGIVANLLLALVSAIVIIILNLTVHNVNMFVHYVYMFFYYSMLINGMLVMFNIIPVFPLDGFRFLITFLKPGNKFINFSVKYGIIILFGIIIVSDIIYMFSGLDIFTRYLTCLYDYLFVPMSNWWGLL